MSRFSGKGMESEWYLSVTRKLKLLWGITCMSSLSSVYCLLLLALYIVSTAIKFSGNKLVHYSEAQVSGLLLYLLFLSCSFLLYILLYLARSNRTVNQSKHSHGSAFLRQGALVFGLGTLINQILNFILLVSDFDCSHGIDIVNGFLAMLFVVLQMLTIIFCPRMKLHLGWGGPHFGLIHIVATNIVLWGSHVLQESLHEFHRAESANEHEQGKGNAVLLKLLSNINNQSIFNNTKAEQSGSIEIRALEIDDEESIVRPLHPLGEDCEHHTNHLASVRQFLEPVLFAFTIEFALIGAAVFYNTWRGVDTLDKKGEQGKGVVRPDIKQAVSKIDFSNSFRGMLIGLFMLTINIVSLIAFFCTSSLNEYIDEYIAKVLESIVYSCGMLAALMGICQVHGLQNTAEAVHASVDRVLLYFGLFFVFAHTSFIIPVGLLVPPSDVTRIPGALHVITGILNILQASLQVVFISLLLTKTICPGENRHPGRQVCTMLVILNFGLWLEDTFVMQKYRASMVEREFYGITAWVPIQRITLPVCIFFRFHSLVMLVDIWKNSYKVDSLHKEGPVHKVDLLHEGGFVLKAELLHNGDSLHKAAKLDKVELIQEIDTLPQVESLHNVDSEPKKVE